MFYYIDDGTDYTVTYSANTKVGTVEVTITGTGSYIGEIKSSFDILPAKQKIQKLTAKSKAFFIDWAQKGSATGYEVQYATNSKFTANKKYYVKVRSYTLVKGTKYFGEWSVVKSVTTKK